MARLAANTGIAGQARKTSYAAAAECANELPAKLSAKFEILERAAEHAERAGALCVQENLAHRFW